jgi:hypothetical protein
MPARSVAGDSNEPVDGGHRSVVGAGNDGVWRALKVVNGSGVAAHDRDEVGIRGGLVETGAASTDIHGAVDHAGRRGPGKESKDKDQWIKLRMFGSEHRNPSTKQAIGDEVPYAWVV